MVNEHVPILARSLAVSVIIALTLMGTAMGEISRTGLVGEWHFDGDAKDSSRNGNDGMIYGATFVDGKFGKALSFDGVDDYVNLGSWFNYQTFTISMWVNPAAYQVAYANIIDNNHVYNTNFVMQQRANTVNRYVWAPGDGTIIGDDISCSNMCVNFNLISNWWNYIVITRDASTRESRVFINGEFLSYATGKTDINYTGDQFIRLGTWGHGDRNWNGTIDEIRIYSRALSADEIKANYEAGQIIITSSISGAEVLLDGLSKGTASPSITVSGIAPGLHTVKCKLAGYSDYDTSVTVAVGSVASVTCTLTSLVTTTPTTTPAPTLASPSLILTAPTPTAIAPAPTLPTQTPTSTPTTPKSASITGRVLDAKTGEPVQGGTITVDGKSATTGSNGEYELSVDMGKHNLSVSEQGYETVTRSIIVPEVGTMLDLSLRSTSGDSSLFWIAIILLVIGVVAGLTYLMYRRKKLKEKEVKERREKEEKERKAKEKKRFCMYCHAPLSPDAKFCPECGKKQEEKTRFCMNCGAPMPLAPDLCPKCSKMPPSDVDTKNCRNCGEVIPKVANFCSACGAGQPE